MRPPRNAIAVLSWLIAVLLLQACSDSGGEPLAEPSASEPVAVEGRAAPATTRRGTARTVADPLSEYTSQCPAGAPRSLECEWLRGLVVAEAARVLELIELSRDQRGVEKALAALEILDEPEVLIAACRILGGFVDAPGIAAKVVPLLDSPYHEVQRIAADLLSRVPDPALNAMGHQWTQNHGGTAVRELYGEIAFPKHYAGMGFPEYPGTERFTPADSDRSIGWWSSDPPSTVASRLGETLGVEVLTYQQWAERVQQKMMSVSQSLFDPKKMEEIQNLTAEYMKTQDEKLVKRIEALQKELSAPMERAESDMANSVDSVTPPSSVAQIDQIYYLIAEEKDGHVARLILVYRQPVVERTVMQMAWNLSDYPPAWGESG